MATAATSSSSTTPSTKAEWMARIANDTDSSKPVSKTALTAASTLPLKPADVTLKGRHVTLRPTTAKDAEPLFAACNGTSCYGCEPYDSQAIWRYLFQEPPKTVEEMADQLQLYINLPNGRAFTILDNATERIIGTLTFLNNVPRNLTVELGCIWYTPAYQRTYANTDTILTCLEYLFKLGYRRVEWKCDSLNVRSAATAVKLGFTPCGVFRNHMIIKGKSRDTAWFEIIEEDSKKVIAALHAKLDKYKQ